MIALYDSHCHLDDARLADDLDATLARAAGAGVRDVLVPGVGPAQWSRALTLRSVAHASGVTLRFAAGIHPEAVDAEGEAATAGALDALDAWIDRLGAVAVGELGWDKRRSRAALARQTEVAGAQLALARRRGLPIVLHCVGAHAISLEELARHAPIAGAVHAYSGSAALVPRYLALGLSISFGPSVTSPRARRPIEAAIATPLDRLLVETDGPDQRPHGVERDGEPAHVEQVVEAIARARGEPVELVARATRENAARLFG